jgi:TIR domain
LCLEIGNSSDVPFSHNLTRAGVGVGKIFISYRRNDSEGEAGRLAADLEREFGEESVFIDVNAIEPGLDFRGKIQRQIAGCNVLIAIIGPNWTLPREEPTGKRGARTDYVHLEISWALKRRLRVIPVLVRGARMPGAKALPEELKRLAVRNAVELRHAHWNSDLQLLVTALRKIVGSPKVEAVEESPIEAEPEIEDAPTEDEIESLPAIEPASVEASHSSGSSFWGIVCLAIFIVVLYFYFTASSPADKPPPQAAPAKRIELKPR